MFRRFPQAGLAIVLVFSLFWANRASALTESSGFELTLDAPRECPSEAQVTAAVAALLTTKPPEPLKVDAKIERDAAHFTLDVGWGSGRRRVQGDSCEAVAGALVAIVALAIDPAAQVENARTGQADFAEAGPSLELLPAEPAARKEAAVPKQRISVRTHERPVPRGRGFELGASLLAQGEWGALPAASYGPAAYVRGVLGPWSAELGGSWLWRQWAQVAEVDARKGGYISWMALEANGCRALARWATACGGVEVGELRGEGEGLSDNAEGRSRGLPERSARSGAFH